MALWQVMLGSVAGIMAGTAIGGFCYYMHIRYVNKRPVRVQDVFGLLFTVKRRQASLSKGSPDAVARPREVRSSVAVPMPTVVARGPQEVPNTIAVPAATVVARRPQEVSNRVAAPAATVAGKRPQEVPSTVAVTAAALSTENHPAALFPVEERHKENAVALILEIERNRKAAREFSGDNLVPLRTGAWEASQRMVASLNHKLQDKLDAIYTDIGLLNHLVWLATEFNHHTPTMREKYLTLNSSIAERLDELVRTAPVHAAPKERPAVSPATVLQQSLTGHSI